MRADLHIHTIYSDGEQTPSNIVKNAAKYGLDFIAITDHDTVSGLNEARQQAKNTNLKVVGGVELSAFDSVEVHILGYNKNWNSQSLGNDLSYAQSLRAERNDQVFKKLSTLNIDISLNDILEFLPSAQLCNIGRSHIAKAMVLKGYSQSVPDAFDVYLKKGACAYIKSCRLTPTEALQVVEKNNGISVLAHPLSLGMSFYELEDYIKKLVNNGLKGIEANYFSHTNFEIATLTKIAKKYNLLTTGGSDYHNTARGGVMGEKFYYINEEMVAALEN